MNQPAEPVGREQKESTDIWAGIPRQLLLQLILILINAFFAMTEMAVVTLNAGKVRRMAEGGGQGRPPHPEDGGGALRLPLHHPDRHHPVGLSGQRLRRGELFPTPW